MAHCSAHSRLAVGCFETLSRSRPTGKFPPCVRLIAAMLGARAGFCNQRNSERLK